MAILILMATMSGTNRDAFHSLAVLHRLQDDNTRHVIIDLQGIARFGSSFLETLRRIWSVSKVR